MKDTAKIFAYICVFLVIMDGVYWWTSHDPTGTAALVMATGLSGMIAYYLYFTNRRIGNGPDDRADAEPHEGAGEQGFFSPTSWWPFTLVLALATLFLGVAIGFWLCYFAVPFVLFGVYGLVMEYYRGENKHY
jgi:F0F1-type ATP synthase membrane subunit a